MTVFDKANVFCVSVKFEFGSLVPDSKLCSHVSWACVSPHLIPCPPRQLFPQAIFSHVTQEPNLSANENHLSSSHTPEGAL